MPDGRGPAQAKIDEPLRAASHGVRCAATAAAIAKAG